MTIFESLADRRDRVLVARADRQRYFARVAQLNWKVETAPLIESEMKDFFSGRHGRWVLLPPVATGTTVQADLHTDCLLPKTVGSVELIRETPASLVYSVHPNGSVAVIACSHTSAHSSKEPLRYIIDVIPHVWSLAGIAGRAQVRRHLRTFAELAILTRAEAQPSRASGRFLRRLSERSEEFTAVLVPPGEARRHRLGHDANLGIGLIAGLIASTIWPFAREFGIEAGKRATLTMASCKDGFSSGPRLARCLSDGTYRLDRALESFLSTGSMLLMALILTTVSLWLLWRIKHQR